MSRAHSIWSVLLIVCACGTQSTYWDSDVLSDALSIGGLSRQPVYGSGDPPQIVAVRIEADVINVGYGPIDVPFTINWVLRDSQGSVQGSGSATRRETLNAGASWHVSLSIQVPPVQSLNELQDLVTFDLVEGP